MGRCHELILERAPIRSGRRPSLSHRGDHPLGIRRPGEPNAHGVGFGRPATDNEHVRRVAGVLFLVVAVAFVVGGVVTMFAPEGDLGRSNLIKIGLLYMLIGLCLGYGGGLLVRRK